MTVELYNVKVMCTSAASIYRKYRNIPIRFRYIVTYHIASGNIEI